MPNADSFSNGRLPPRRINQPAGDAAVWLHLQPVAVAPLRRIAGQKLIACLGHAHCQRNFRSLTCRSFPFFPYITRQGEFDGLSYYWAYEDRCWVISNLQAVTRGYLAQFMTAYRALFAAMPAEKDNFRHYSNGMRRIFGRQKRAIPLLHHNGHAYKITPRGGRMRRVALERLPKFGPYKIAAEMPFPDEE